MARRGLSNNTLFIFCSDNGGPTSSGASNGPLRAGKGTLYEGGVRVVACAAWKGVIPAGTVVEAPLHIVDWYPTLLRLAGASMQQELPLDGHDLWPALTENDRSPHEQILLNASPSGGAIRVNDWKLVVHAADTAIRHPNAAGAQQRYRSIELFQISTDRSERENLAAEHPDRVKRLLRLLEAYQQQAVPPKDGPRPLGFRVPEVWGPPDN